MLLVFVEIAHTCACVIHEDPLVEIAASNRVERGRIIVEVLSAGLEIETCDTSVLEANNNEACVLSLLD